MPATAAALLCLCLVVPAGAGDWRVLEPGLELGTFVSPTPSPIGDCTITVLRVDPARFDLVLAMGSELADDGSANRTAREWVTDADLLAAINASMARGSTRSPKADTPVLRTHPSPSRSAAARDSMARGSPI